MRRAPVTVPEFVALNPVQTNFFRTADKSAKRLNSDSLQLVGDGPILFLHGFDSSVLEFRRVLPNLEEMGAEAYAVDVLGWGFTEVKGVLSFGAGETDG